MTATRRSRAGSTGTRRHRNQTGLSSLSHTTPADHGRTDAEASAAAAVAAVEKSGSDSARERASPLGSPMNRSTTAHCRHCKASIGDFYNAWHKVTGSYFVPALLGSYTHLLQNTGKVKAASKGNDVEGW